MPKSNKHHRNYPEAEYNGILLRDASRKGPQYSVFGDTITGVKQDEVSVSFQFGVSTFDATTFATGTGAVTSVIPQAQVATGTLNGACFALLQSVQAVRYRAGKEGYSYFTCEFTTQADGVTGIANSTQQIGLFDAQNGIWLGFSGLNFCVARRKQGVDTIVTRANFNRDKLDGTGPSRMIANFSMNNVFKISFGYLGAAVIVYEILSPIGIWVPFHVVEYPGSAKNTHISNPVLPVACRAEKTTGATNVIMRTSSWSAGTITGDFTLEVASRPFAFSNTKTLSAGVLTSVFSLFCQTTYAGLSNRIPAQMLYVTAAADGTKNVEVRLMRNPVLGGTPNYTPIDAANSVTYVDTAGTTVTQGTQQLPFILGKTEGRSIDVSGLRMYIMPGEILTFAAVSANASDVSIGCRWIDKF